jgi:hypothetical protein
MPDNPVGERGRALEDDYFRKRDRELIEKMRRSAAVDGARDELSQRTGLQDADLEELRALGFTADTASLLPLIPLVQVAWAEGGVSDAERTLILRLARERGIAEGSAADGQLSDWLASPPNPEVFTRAYRLIAAMLDGPAAGTHGLTADDLVSYSERIAAASGGILGLNRVSREERALLAAIAQSLKASKV